MIPNQFSVTLSMITLTWTFQIGSAQPRILDLSFSDGCVAIRWESQCERGLEISNIIYGCSQVEITECDLITVSHRSNDSMQPYREKQLPLPAMTIGENWKCVFKLQGVQSNNCKTINSTCVLVDVPRFLNLRGMI